MWDLIVLVPDYCLSFYFSVAEKSVMNFCFIFENWRNRKMKK